MEDTHTVMDDVVSSWAEGDINFNDKLSFYGVYDGHGGRECAIKTQELLHKNIINDPSFAEDVGAALRSGFASTDKEILEVSTREGWKSGSTVVVCVVRNGQLWVANVGDSEAVMGKRKLGNELAAEDGKVSFYSPILLSQKHKPGEATEKDRIKAAGGHVVFGRVMGSLAVARAFGDREFKVPCNRSHADFVSAEPYINSFTLTNCDEFLIVCCDGLWDKMSYQDACEIVGRCRNVENLNPTEAAQRLVTEAISRGSLDNVTAVVTYLSQDVNPLVACPPSHLLEKTPEKIPEKSPESSESEAKEEKPTKPKKSSKVKKSSSAQTSDSEELIDAYQFIRKDIARSTDDSAVQTNHREKFKEFNLEERIVAEFPCMYEKKMLYSGILLLTEKHICFHSNMFGKRIRELVPMTSISSIEKTRSLLVTRAIKITTQDGRKRQFNWNQNVGSRDSCFSKLLQLIDSSQDQHPVIKEVETETNPRDLVSESEAESEPEKDKYEEPPKKNVPKVFAENQTWSRFDD
eukprot:TRINITY_DN1753_c0_g1_i1.p1 TRINITY_DN1753_c0_g1~~TRINITY_DN1753_c0_g1_i1.p1  ORF type:complete len:570 (+),score=127.79 TRINITY_DN1753_c0_g1_i1:148-1710(+)